MKTKIKPSKNKHQGFMINWSTDIMLNFGTHALIDKEIKAAYVMGAGNNFIFPMSFESIEKIYKALK